MTIAVPLLFFPLLEFGLRAGGYGTDLRLFITETIGGRPYLIMNPDVHGRYFPRSGFTPTTSADLLELPRDPASFRIVFLGGSTTVGYPYGVVGSFSTLLRDRLRALFPERRFEVVNLGMTATNSFTTLDIARELSEIQPDLIVVYDGHNEFYGALGMASRESVGRSRWLTTLYLRMARFRTVQLLRSLMLPTGEGGPERGRVAGGTLMERLAAGQTVSAGDPVYAAAEAAFAANLSDLADVCREHGIPLILTTQASNLRHQAPFVSLLRRADEKDTTRAGTAYRAAQELDSVGRTPEALAAYRTARDMDELRFRTDSRFNDLIRAQAGPGVTVVDAESLFAANSPDGIPGRELFLEHLHPTARGYFLLGAAYARAIRGMGLVSAESGWAARDTLPEEHFWALRRLTVLDEEAAARRTRLLTSGWPFRSVTIPPPDPDPGDPRARIVEDLVRGRTTWEQAHVAAAQLCLSRGDTLCAEREYLALINQLPQNVSAYLLLAQLRVAGGRFDEAEAPLTASLPYEETATARRMLGGLALQAGRHADAAVHLERAFTLSGPVQDRAEAGYLLAVALSRSGGEARAREVLAAVLALDAGFAPARRLLERLERRGPE